MSFNPCSSFIAKIYQQHISAENLICQKPPHKIHTYIEWNYNIHFYIQTASLLCNSIIFNSLDPCVLISNLRLPTGYSLPAIKRVFRRQKQSCLSHSERRPQNIYSQEEMNLYCIIKLATKISLFSLQISKTLFCVDKIKYEHLAILSNLNSCQFAAEIVIFNLCICCQFEDSQIISPKILPMSHSQHLTVTNEGSFFAENFSFSFGT